MPKSPSGGKPVRDPRREALDSYIQELTCADPVRLAGLVPPDPGIWGLPELDREENGIRLSAMAWRPDDRVSPLLFVIEVGSERAIHKVFVDGFAVDSSGTVRPMTPDEWAFWNI